MRTQSPDAAARVAHLQSCFSGPEANVAALLCDGRDASAIAYTVVDRDLSATVLTYGDLRDRSERFAAALADMGVGKGDRVATLMGKSAEYLTAVLAVWRLGAVHVPLFTAFAPLAIEMRLRASNTKIVVCDVDQSEKLGAIADGQQQFIVVGGGRSQVLRARAFDELIEHPNIGQSSAAVGGDAALIHIFTSGTTGDPKGVIAPVKALAAFQIYAEFGLDLTASDTYWCAADPGWAYGLYFGILGSFTTGVPSLLLKGGFDAALTWKVLSTFGVTNFAAAPTIYRGMRAAGRPPEVELSLRRASSAGEPLTPEVNDWARGVLGVDVYDHYGQTEAGMLINNHHHPVLQRPLKMGSMGHPMPGWEMVVLRHESDEVAEVGAKGRIAADLTASPLAWFQGYDGAPDLSAEKLSAEGWYLTGDVGHMDEEGYFFFSSRDDDVIIMAGYRIGPFEVESVLLKHEKVLECAVIAVPDSIRGEVIEAFVVLRADAVESDELVEELQQHVKQQFAAHAYPRAIHFTSKLPKTPSGKIQRYVLRTLLIQASQEKA